LADIQLFDVSLKRRRVRGKMTADSRLFRSRSPA
jgi:hypothetical protein